MQIVETIAELRAKINECKHMCLIRGDKSPSVGLVPTMGYLHEGHASLIRKAREECGVVVVSVFVNPLQFGPNEDLDRYPRDLDRDAALAEACGADLLFHPTVEVMYPQYPLYTKVTVSNMTDKLCGSARPGHFDGVATVVSKLFHIVDPEKAYFGLKDAQQIAVIKQMTDDLNFRVEVVPCPTVRDEGGLALSSRNVYLSEEERAQATVLNKALSSIDAWLDDPKLTIAKLREQVVQTIRNVPLASIEYVEVLQYPSLQNPGDDMLVVSTLDVSDLIVALAVRFGRTRLIDNRIVQYKEVKSHV